eukprot:CAMPEP_0170527238 /NCGR_PEP_ID=MMETSP0209-20121228/12708_1 /TAXON_ID=665100 ORGANISM="Litonotus pictus, Strain P1" /NCGR_SAMPLE_ID=MMETSP0209 /ASSEMBLY_ACC=CAM_ASM_000301 /LENGTH=104 /DNA_ID=CAMNT_0010817631 /DNA_START=192 /DNA_END=503 /DNA_ORIENTATION=-
MDVLLDTTYFNTNLKQLIQSRDPENPSSFQRERKTIGLEKCSEAYRSDFIDTSISKEQLDVVGLLNHMCLKNETFVIGGSYYDMYFSNLFLEIKRCVNSTENNN